MYGCLRLNGRIRYSLLYTLIDFFLDWDKMADTAPPYLYKETRLNVESAIPGSTVVIRLPNYGASKWSSRTAQTRLPTEIPLAEDESAFKQRHLASAASLFSRQYHKFPRSFLWRVLEDRKVLSIQAADLCKQDKIPDAHLTLRLTFPSPIRPSCIALSDCKEHDTFSVFSLTESNHLYTLTLRPEFFRRRSTTEENVRDWCKIYLSSAFGFKHPHRLVALGNEELVVSLHDGGLLRLNRVPGEDSSVWKETFYNEGGWSQGLRSLIPFQSNNTIRYGKINIELSAITSIASPSTIIDGRPYAFAVSLDHRIRVWNLASGKIAYTGDLLDQTLPPNEASKYVIHPSHSELIRVYENSDGGILAVTYSPSGAGQFKFWTVVPEDGGNLEMRDRFPDEILEPPAPTSDVWTLADFSALINKYDRNTAALWILWKNNTTYRVQKVDFQMDSSAHMRNAWANGWSSMASETLMETALPTLLPSDPSDCTEKWLEYILFPGRYTAATIETALSIYEKGLRGSKDISLRSSKTLAERMCSVVASTTNMDRNSEGLAEYDHFRMAADMQWRRFYRLVAELDKQRGEALSLAFDPEHQMAWVITADGLSAIRECSFIEKLWHNPDNSGGDDTVTRLVSAASLFRDSFSDGLLHNCEAILTAELFRGLSFADVQSVRSFYDKCNFAGQIVDEDYTQLLANLGGSFRGLKNDVYQSLLEAMTTSEEYDTRLERLPFAALGMKAVVRGVQETIHLHRTICLDQLMLLVFVEMEVDQEEEGVQLETAPVCKHLLTRLKRLELLSWLSKTQMLLSIPRLERSNSMTDSVSSTSTKRSEELKKVTVLEGILGHLWGLIAHSGESTASLLTDILERICDPDSDYELEPALMQCFLLKLERPDLALEISRFCGQDPFSIYIQGRAHLLAKDLPAAAVYFKKAAFGLGMPNFCRQF
jgi:nuclear pore complex protein Nup160